MTDPDLRALITQRVRAGLVSCDPTHTGPALGQPVWLLEEPGIPAADCAPCGRPGATRQVGTVAMHDACFPIWLAACRVLEAEPERR